MSRRRDHSRGSPSSVSGGRWGVCRVTWSRWRGDPSRCAPVITRPARGRSCHRHKLAVDHVRGKMFQLNDVGVLVTPRASKLRLIVTGLLTRTVCLRADRTSTVRSPACRDTPWRIGRPVASVLEFQCRCSASSRTVSNGRTSVCSSDQLFLCF